MGTKMNKEYYQKLIDEDLEWLNKQPRTLERMHIADIVKESIDFYYPKQSDNLPISGVVGSFVLYREGAIDNVYWNGEEFTPYRDNIPAYTWDKANEYSTLLNCNFCDK